MKRTSTVLACTLALLLLSLPAYSDADPPVLLGIGNDTFSLGLGNNQDDGKTYSLSVSAYLPGIANIALEMTSFTDQKYSQQRYDTLQATASYPHLLYNEPRCQITITPLLGLTAVGSLGMEAMQNWQHQNDGKPAILLPPALQGTSVHPTGGVNVLVHLPNGKHAIDVALAGSHTIGWESDLTTSIGYSLGHTIAVSLGYHLSKGHSGYPSQYLQEDRYNGFFLSADYDANLLFTSYRYYPHSGFSFGFIGFDVLAFSRPKTFIESSFTTVHGLLFDVEAQSLRQTGIGRGDVFFEILYTSGPFTTSSTRYNIAQYSIAYQKRLFPTSEYLRPSIEVGAGVKRFNLVQNFDEVLLEEIRPVLTLELALGLGPRPLWIVANTAYSVELGARLTHVLASESLVTNVGGYDRHTKAWVFLLGLTLVVDHDLS